ncbi:hypothetical protein MAR_007079 [Mya arenaria]|uniref:Integrase catalytic domain-containing protein n=1 Tax=Mya arenaria TaxID=6604 RepID=A0ABY7DBE3_MYAAR|nr:hypothetical protein MAR_007079 [Mya arenaria]
MLSISESTVYRRMRQFELSKMTYSDVDSHVVEKAVKEIVSEFPRCGERMIQPLLRHQHIKDRSHRRIHRRVYEVPGPNHLWHVDTNHKLIRWHLIIVGGIDGFSRLVTFLKCTDNNKADTVFKCFQEGVHEFGVPLRVRTDMGRENVGIAYFMIQSRGFESMLTGKSTHNQRI